MAEDTHDVGLMAVPVDGVAHRFAVDGQAVIVPAIDCVPPLPGAVELGRVDADENIADDVFTGHQVVTAAAPAAEALARRGRQVVGPLGDGLVPAHAAQDRAGGDGQHRWQRVAPSLAAARIGDVGKEIGQGSHLLGGQHDLGRPHTIGWIENRSREGASACKALTNTFLGDGAVAL